MPFEPGHLVGDYQVIDVLGKGGMGRVYRVRNVISDRIEAMKVLLDDVGSDAGIEERFIAEIRTLARLDHPNIAKLHTAFKFDRQLLMVMEFVEGKDLANCARDGAIPLDHVVAYMQQVLSGLGYAHKNGVVHRDIKPSNIMVTTQGMVKLMDFGIAKSNAEPLLTRPGTTLGSLLYMSPEQVRGTPVDPRSDLYSLGVVLYQLTAGRCPFEADSTYQILDAQLNAAPPPPMEINPALPPALNEIILTALQKDPANRFQNAEAFRNVLGGALAGGSVQTQPMPRAESPARPVTGPGPAPASKAQTGLPPNARQAPPANTPKGNRSLWMAAGALACVCVLGAALIALPHFRSTSAASQTSAPPPTSAPPSNPAPAGTPAALAPVPSTTQTPTNSPPIETKATSDVKTASTDLAPKRKPTSSITRNMQPQPEPTAPAPSPTAAPPAPPPGPSEAQLKNADETLMKMHARADAVNASLASLKQEQAAQGLGLRGDIVAAESRMGSYLQMADHYLQSRDLDSAQKYTDQAEQELVKLEHFLGR